MHPHPDRRRGGIAISTILTAVLVFGSAAVVAPTYADSEGTPLPPFMGGSVVAWGRDSEGQATLPAALDGKTVTAVAAGGSHTLALTSDGTIVGWGRDGEGQATAPDALEGKTVTAIAAGGDHSLALTSDGVVTAWGRDGEGQATVPDALEGKTVTAIAAGDYHSMALTHDGTVTAWGDSGFRNTSIPGTLTGKTVTAIAAGGYHSLALTSDGVVTAWGRSSDDQTKVPASLNGRTVTAIAAGGYHSLAVTSDGTITHWGRDEEGQALLPEILTGKRVTAIAGGEEHSVAATSDGTVAAWGNDSSDQSSIPETLTGRVVTAVAAGRSHSLAIATTFAAEHNPVITGDPHVGDTITADPGRYTAEPDTLDYQWYADNAAIPGATSSTLTLVAAQRGKRFTVRVTAALTGHAPVVMTSSPVGPVIGVPAIQLTAAKASLRRGQTTTLTWTSTEATTLSATGAWTGPRAATGILQVKPAAIGTTAYMLTGSNGAGTTTAQVQIKVIRPAARLKITAPKTKLRPGTKIKIKIRGLEAGERYTLRIGKRKVATGTAKNNRPLAKKVKLPKTTGKAILRVTGDQPDRTGTTKLRVVRR